MIEAVCTKCGEIFIPHSAEPEDMIHGETQAGKPCGGVGVVQGEWIFPSIDSATEENPVIGVITAEGKLRLL